MYSPVLIVFFSYSLLMGEGVLFPYKGLADVDFSDQDSLQTSVNHQQINENVSKLFFYIVKFLSLIFTTAL